MILNLLLAAAVHAFSAMPESPRGSGGELIGKPLDLDGLRWIKRAEDGLPGKDAQVILLRWFTDGCPFCARSMPVLTRLKAEFGERGFETVAVYHPKPPRRVSRRDVLKAAADLEYTGPLAVDQDWSTLRRLYLARHPEGATSVSFLLDREGRVRYVHPGPEFGPTGDPERRHVNQDYQDIRAAIESLLDERPDR